MTYLWWCGLLRLRIYFELNVTKEYSAKAHTKNYNILQKQHKVLLYKHAYPEIRGTSFFAKHDSESVLALVLVPFSTCWTNCVRRLRKICVSLFTHTSNWMTETLSK